MLGFLTQVICLEQLLNCGSRSWWSLTPNEIHSMCRIACRLPAGCGTNDCRNVLGRSNEVALAAEAGFELLTESLEQVNMLGLFSGKL